MAHVLVLAFVLVVDTSPPGERAAFVTLGEMEAV